MNLSDSMFRGIYHGKCYHAPDIPEVLQRAHKKNVEVLLLTGSSIPESQQVMTMSAAMRKASPVKLYYTIGVHPCCVNEFVEAAPGATDAKEDDVTTSDNAKEKDSDTSKDTAENTAVIKETEEKPQEKHTETPIAEQDKTTEEVKDTEKTTDNSKPDIIKKNESKTTNSTTPTTNKPLATEENKKETTEKNEVKSTDSTTQPTRTIWDVVTAPVTVDTVTAPSTASADTKPAEVEAPHPDTNQYSTSLYRSLTSNDEDTRNHAIGIARGRLQELYKLLQSNVDDPHFRAIGEFGLDYERLHYTCKELQLIFFAEQLKMVCLLNSGKSLFLHMRKAGPDFIGILRRFRDGFTDERDTYGWRELTKSSGPIHYKFEPGQKFVVHSYTDSLEDLNNLLDLSPHCYIGLNGASFRTEDNIEAVRRMPMDRILLETDAPWCEIRSGNASNEYLKDWPGYPEFTSVKNKKLAKIPRKEWANTMVKSRNEPCMMAKVAHVVAGVKEKPLQEVVESVWKTSCKVYGQ